MHFAILLKSNDLSPESQLAGANFHVEISAANRGARIVLQKWRQVNKWRKPGGSERGGGGEKERDSRAYDNKKKPR